MWSVIGSISIIISYCTRALISLVSLILYIYLFFNSVKLYNFFYCYIITIPQGYQGNKKILSLFKFYYFYLLLK